MTVYDIITQRIIDGITKDNVLPWRKDWRTINPKNANTKKEYRGINFLLLSLIGNSEYFATFNQIKAAKGHLKAGSKGLPVCFWKRFEDTKDSSGNVTERGYAMLRYYTVFRLEDVENHGFKLPVRENKVVSQTAFEDLLAASNVDLRHGGNRAYYCPASHHVQMPAREQFASSEGYWATLAHELVHWSGKEVSGLDAAGVGEEYSKEELVAEIGANMLLAQLGIDASKTYDNSISYVKGWLSKLSNDTRLVISAAGIAQKRVDWLLGKLGKVESDIDTEEVTEAA